MIATDSMPTLLCEFAAGVCRFCERPGSDSLKRRCKPPKEPHNRAPMAFRSYAQLKADLLAWLPHLPRLSAVCGVPRSGSVVASILSELLDLPLIPIDNLAHDPPLPHYRPRSYRTVRAGEGPILVIDDTCSTGRTMRQVKQFVKARNVIFGAVYIGDGACDELDIAGYSHAAGGITFDWNLFADDLAERLAVDLDGIFHPEWVHGRETGAKAVAYDHFLKEPLPLEVPRRKVAAIITARLECHRPQTERWLAKHGIRYGRLMMHPNVDPPHSRNAVKHKVESIRKVQPIGFVESERQQAWEIHRHWGGPVLWLPWHRQQSELFGGSEMVQIFPAGAK